MPIDVDKYLSKEKSKEEKKYQRSLKRRWRWGKVWHAVLWLFTLILALFITLAGALGVFFLGPSQTMCDMLTNTLMETSALKFVPYLYMNEESVAEVLSRTQLIEPDTSVDTALIEIADITREEKAQEDYKDIEVVNVKGPTFKGYMMIVRDPSRVFVGVCSENFGSGLAIEDMVAQYGAVAGTNASGFEDEGGKGNGGNPLGLVISEGKMLRNSTTRYTVAGFDQDNKLIVGKYNTQQALELNLRDAVAFGPALIVNGEPAEVSDTQTGLNPRTAIGQRADGAVLMLVIDGRHASSLGASYSDLIDVMMEFEAVNACNLDGGSSSVMFYEGKQINDAVPFIGYRRLPTAILVRKEAE